MSLDAPFRVVTGSESLRLPTVNIPSVFSTQTREAPGEVPPTALSRASSHYATAVQYSESEDDNFISEVDRDAQLAYVVYSCHVKEGS